MCVCVKKIVCMCACATVYACGTMCKIKPKKYTHACAYVYF